MRANPSYLLAMFFPLFVLFRRLQPAPGQRSRRYVLGTASL